MTHRYFAASTFDVHQDGDSWNSFKAAIENLVVPDDFLNAAERDLGEFDTKDPFEGWSE